jgi:hypothetical protein
MSKDRLDEMGDTLAMIMLVAVIAGVVFLCYTL